MSYSFNIRAATKAAAKAMVAAELDKVVNSQAVHARDRDQAQAAADAFIDTLDEDDSKDVTVAISGYLSGQWMPDGGLQIVTGASVSVNASMAAKLPAA